MMLSKALGSLGIPSKGYNGHSFHIGAATWAVLLKVSGVQIQALGWWKSGAFNSYIHPPTRAWGGLDLYTLGGVSQYVASGPELYMWWMLFPSPCWSVFLFVGRFVSRVGHRRQHSILGRPVQPSPFSSRLGHLARRPGCKPVNTDARSAHTPQDQASSSGPHSSPWH